jgi:hypothetical protein
MLPRFCLLVTAATLSATALRAQTLDLPVQSNVLSINPFGFLFEWYNIEYEHAFRSTASWSIGAGHIDVGDDDDESTYTSVDAPSAITRRPRRRRSSRRAFRLGIRG